MTHDTLHDTLHTSHLEHNGLDVVVVQDELLHVGRLPEQGGGDHRQLVVGEIQPC